MNDFAEMQIYCISLLANKSFLHVDFPAIWFPSLCGNLQTDCCNLLLTTAATPSATATATATATIISTKGWMKLRGCEWRLVLAALLLWLPLAIRDVVACCCCASVCSCCNNSCHVVAVSDSSNITSSSSSSNIDRGQSLGEHDRRWRCLMMRWRYFFFTQHYEVVYTQKSQ